MGKNDLSGLAVHFAQRLCGQSRRGPGPGVGGRAGGLRRIGPHLRASGVRSSSKGIPGSWEVFEARLVDDRTLGRSDTTLTCD